MSATAPRRGVASPRRPSDAWWAVAVVASAAVWFAVLVRGADAGEWLPAKGVPVALLALWALRRHRPGAALLAAALACHAAGDLLLEIEFLAGLAAFFAGHLLYIAVFWRHRRELDEMGGGDKLAIGLLGLVAAGCVLFLAPRLHGPIAFSVPIYAAALAGMAGASWLSRPGRPWVPLGATLFVASDALLAVQLFAGGIDGGRLLIWPLYILGQGLIAWGWLATDSVASQAA